MRTTKKNPVFLFAFLTISTIGVYFYPNTPYGSATSAEKYPPLITTHEFEIPLDTNAPDGARRLVHFFSETTPIVERDGKIRRCVFRWQDRTGKGETPLRMKLRGLNMLKKIGMYIYYRGKGIPLTFETEEEKRGCEPPLRVSEAVLDIYNENGQFLRTIRVKTYTPDIRKRAKQKKLDTPAHEEYPS